MNNILSRLNLRLQKTDPPYQAFILFVLFNTFYLLYISQKNFFNANVLTGLHLGLMIWSFVLLIRAWWPQSWHRYTSIIWYGYLVYSLCVFPWVLCLLESIAYINVMSCLFNIFFLFMITDWAVACGLLLIASIISMLIIIPLLLTMPNYHWAIFSRGWFFLSWHPYLSVFFVWMMLSTLLFSRNIQKSRDNINLRQQVQATLTIASSLAHELRTPLLTIDTGLHLAQENLKVTSTSNSLAKAHYDAIVQAQQEVKHSNTLLDMLLTNLNSQTDTQELTRFTVDELVTITLDRYPFKTSTERQWVVTQIKDNFIIEGKILLLQHVLFNLIKNALYAIKQKESGSLFIYTDSCDQGWQLIIKDNGVGIKPEILSLIFKPFYTSKTNGSGIGLAFCKMTMQQLGGNISCQSELGKGSTFTLTFSKIKADIQ